MNSTRPAGGRSISVGSVVCVTGIPSTAITSRDCETPVTWNCIGQEMPESWRWPLAKTPCCPVSSV
jgi:hypothetical protein